MLDDEPQCKTFLDFGWLINLLETGKAQKCRKFFVMQFSFVLAKPIGMGLTQYPIDNETLHYIHPDSPDKCTVYGGQDGKCYHIFGTSSHICPWFVSINSASDYDEVLNNESTTKCPRRTKSSWITIAGWLTISGQMLHLKVRHNR
jgi:hypothetical protein